MKDGGKKGWKEAFRFSGRERRALLYLLPVLAVASWLVWEIARPRFNDSFPEYADFTNSRDASTATAADTTRLSDSVAAVTTETVDSLFRFDPNTIEYHDLCRLGFSRNEALGIVKYRERGKVFEIPEDFASCYQVSESMYLRLKPFINIGGEYRLAPHEKRAPQSSSATPKKRICVNTNPDWTPAPFSLDTMSAEGFQLMGFSARQAQVIVNYRDMKGGLRSAAEFAECYVVSDEMFSLLEPWLVFPEVKTASHTPLGPVNLNTADSAALRSVRGIGEKTVTRIIDYRQRLGGFHNIQQLAEVQGVTEENYTRICEQIFVDSCDIQKIDINFASAKQLGTHPYIGDKALRKLLKLRQLKGGWSNTGELIEDKIFTSEEAAKLAPYLVFSTSEQPKQP